MIVFMEHDEEVHHGDRLYLQFLMLLFFVVPVEADPKTRRKCGSRLDEPDVGSCEEALEGANKIILCKCGDDLCNGSPRVQGLLGVALVPIMIWLVTFTSHRTWVPSP